MRLGRKALKTDSRTLRLAKYMTSALPPAPASVDWTLKVGDSWGMMLNDNLGDCTIAGCAHAVQVWSANRYKELTIPDPSVLTAYEQWCGYNPANPNTDQGGVELDVLNSWRQNGFDSHVLLGYADANVKNMEEVRQSILLFGCAYIGISLPITAQSQDVWDVTDPTLSGDAAPGSWGGHCVAVPAYDGESFTCVTWGQLKKMTLAFWNAYVDESHALLSPDWMNQTGAPNGFDITTLTNDLALIN